MKKWMGEKKCDLCGATTSTYFVDGKTRMGPWAFMCDSCWSKYGVAKLGTGSGQKYDGETLEKIAG